MAATDQVGKNTKSRDKDADVVERKGGSCSHGKAVTGTIHVTQLTYQTVPTALCLLHSKLASDGTWHCHSH